jgi:hypothetical protein
MAAAEQSLLRFTKCLVHQPSERRLNENDEPIVCPSAFEVKEVPEAGFLLPIVPDRTR